MDTTDSKIKFDEKGVCDHCNTFYKQILPNWHTDERGQEALWGIVAKITGEGEGFWLYTIFEWMRWSHLFQKVWHCFFYLNYNNF